jgi:hypothetical protein
VDKKEYMYKVYDRTRSTLRQRVFDGDFENFSNSNFSTYWEGTGLTGGANNITATNLTTGGTAVSNHTFTTASVTPSANKLQLIWFWGNSVPPSSGVTVTGCGLTWTQVAQRQDSFGVRNLYLFRAMGAAPTTGALTIEFGASYSQSVCYWSLAEFGNVNTNGVNGAAAIVQFASATSSGQTASLSVTLGAFDSTFNATAVGFGYGSAASNLGVGSGFTQIGHNRGTDSGVLSEFKTGNDTSADATFTADDGSIFGIAVELAGPSTEGRVLRNRLQAYPEEQTGYALQLDGLTNFIQVPSIGQGAFFGDGIIFTNDFSIIMPWYKANWNDGRKECFIDQFDNVFGSTGFMLDANIPDFFPDTDPPTGLMRAYCRINGGYRAATYPLANISAGLHYLGLVVRSGVLYLYIDGQIVASNTAGSGGNPEVNGSYATTIGVQYTDAGLYNRYATGIVAGLSVYNTGLTQTQMYDIFISRNPRSELALAHWDFNEGTGAGTADAMGVYYYGVTGAVNWVPGYFGLLRSAMVITNVNGSATQGIQQQAATASIITGGLTYTAHARVMAQAGETISMTVTPTGGGSPQTQSLIADGTWQHLVNIYAANINATRLAIRISIGSPTASVKTFYVDKVALNDGNTPVDYFDRNTVGAGSTVYSFDSDTNSHTLTANVYSFIGTWIDVVSDFTYTQEINSAGSEISIMLARAYPNYNEGVDLDFNLEVRVFMIDDTYINGTPVFRGYISDYTIDEGKESIEVKLFSYGAELDDYTLELGATSIAKMPLKAATNAPTGFWSDSWFLQSLHITETITLDKIDMIFASDFAPFGYNIQIYQGNPSDNFIGVTAGFATYSTGGDILIATSTNQPNVPVGNTSPISFEFAGSLTLDPGDYYVSMIIPGSAIGSNSTGVPAVPGYAPIGRAYSGRATINNATFGVYADDNYPQMYMELIRNTGSAATTVSFDSYDPSQIVRDAMDNYQSQGGNLTYDTLSIPLSGAVTSYDFKSATIFDVIKKALELAPSGWYFFIDHADNKLHFKQKTANAVHTFVVGQHIKDLVFEKRSRDIVNVIYFTGGELSTGVNFFKKYENSASIALYGRRQLLYSDNRVKLESTADTIANGILATRSYPEIRTSPNVVNYDLESIKPGDMVTFRGYESTSGAGGRYDVGKYDSSFYDFNVADPSTYVLQIARLGYAADVSSMTLSTTPPDVNKRIEDINRNLEKQQTLNNPDTPS